MRFHNIVVIHLLSAAVFSMPASQAQATDKNIEISCNASSAYNISMDGQAFVFEGKVKRSPRVVLGGNSLFINGTKADLSKADQKRIYAFEDELRLLVPESRKVVTEAVNIAYDAMSQVGASLSSDPQTELTKYEKSRTKALAGLNQSNALPILNDQSMDDIVKPLVAEFVPSITSQAVGYAFRAMFASDKKEAEMEARLDAMGNELDKRIEMRADALEPLAESMCKRMQRMDVIDESLEIRLPNDKPINFLDVKKAE